MTKITMTLQLKIEKKEKKSIVIKIMLHKIHYLLDAIQLFLTHINPKQYRVGDSRRCSSN